MNEGREENQTKGILVDFGLEIKDELTDDGTSFL